MPKRTGESLPCKGRVDARAARGRVGLSLMAETHVRHLRPYRSHFLMAIVTNPTPPPLRGGTLPFQGRDKNALQWRAANFHAAKWFACVATASVYSRCRASPQRRST